MKKIININGEIFTDKSNAKISVLDRGFLYGDSIYEVTDAYEKRLIFMDEHLDRLWESARKIFLKITYTREEIIGEVQKTLKALDVDRAYIRIIITRGEGEITLNPNASSTNNLVIICKELGANPKEWYEKGVKVVIADTKRNTVESMDPSIKSGNYLNNILAYQEAVEKGVFDAIMLNHESCVTEGTTSNLWIVKDNTYITPPLKAGLLSGITRAKLIELCLKNNMSVVEKNITVDELLASDEVFLTSSTRRIVPVVQVEDKVIGQGKPGHKTIEILEKYLDEYKLGV